MLEVLETRKKGVKNVQRLHWRHQNDIIDVVLVYVLLTLNILHAFL